MKCFAKQDAKWTANVSILRCHVKESRSGLWDLPLQLYIVSPLQRARTRRRDARLSSARRAKKLKVQVRGELSREARSCGETFSSDGVQGSRVISATHATAKRTMPDTRHRVPAWVSFRFVSFRTPSRAPASRHAIPPLRRTGAICTLGRRSRGASFGRSIDTTRARRKSNSARIRENEPVQRPPLANARLSPLFEFARCREADVHSTTNAIRLGQASLPFKARIFHRALLSSGIYKIDLKFRTTSYLCVFIKLKYLKFSNAQYFDEIAVIINRWAMKVTIKLMIRNIYNLSRIWKKYYLITIAFID